MLISCWLSRLMLGLLGLQVVLFALFLLSLLRLVCLLFRCLWFFLDFLLIKRVQLELRFGIIVMLICLLNIHQPFNAILLLLIMAMKMAWLRLTCILYVDHVASRRLVAQGMIIDVSVTINRLHLDHKVAILGVDIGWVERA